jgi:hypothetical protein
MSHMMFQFLHQALVMQDKLQYQLYNKGSDKSQGFNI